MKCYVFAYGTLLDNKTREIVLGYKTSIKTARLRGFRKSSIVLSDIKYPILIKDFECEEFIEGAYFEISEKDLVLIDQYESSSYKRLKVKMDNGLEAWVYCSN